MRAIRRKTVADKIGVHVTMVDRYAKEERFAHLNFPKPFHIGDGSVAFDESEVDAWLEARKAAARGVTAE